MLGEVDLWRRLAAEIAAEIERRGDGIVRGTLDSLERYRFETGFLGGLRWVEDRAQDLMQAPPPKPEADDAG
jgi:hypothetical protein